MLALHEIAEFLSGKTDIYIYGAGIVAHRLVRYLFRYGIHCDGFIVSERDDTSKHEERRVYTWDEARKSRDLERWNVVLAVSPFNVQLFSELRDRLLTMPFRSLFIMSKPAADALRKEDARRRAEEFYRSAVPSDEYFLQLPQERREADMKFLCRSDSTPLFRVIASMDSGDRETLVQYCNISCFEGMYGSLRILPHGPMLSLDADRMRNERIDIYAAVSHFDGPHWGERVGCGSVPIQVGAVLADERKSFITDDTGDNISERNPNYCECTALYWIWKNTGGQDYVGLNHYRRYLLLDQRSMDALRRIRPGVVLALPQFVAESVKRFFTNIISIHDWELMKHELFACNPEIERMFGRYEEGHFYFSCNLCLFQREWFDRYCEFAFSIAERIEQEYARRNVFRADRYMGYIFENLLSLFVMRHYEELNVYCTEVEWKE